jgi:catechol 2,3-dioxygenase-like lactoylglutathione lyase family enzyme
VIERGLHHVSLEVRRPDAEACRDFFVLLGFKKVPHPPALDDIAVWVQSGDLQIHMLYADDPVIPPRGHVAVACPDYEATLAALRAAGHRVEDHDNVWGSPRAFAYSPVGHVVEVMQFPPRD